MIRHLLTLIWNRKQRNLLLLLELIAAFLILFGVFGFVLYNLDKYRTPLGFETENVWQASLFMTDEPDSLTRAAVKKQLLINLRQVPEIAAVCFGNPVTPFSGSTWTSTSDDNGYEISAELVAGDEDYAQTFGLNVLEGRWFTEEDQNAKYSSLVINKRMRDTYWKDTSVIGKVIQWNGDARIIGVVEHFKYQGEFSDENNLIFSYFPDHSSEMPTLIMRLKPGYDPSVEVQISNIIRQTTKDWKFTIKNLENQRIQNSRQYWVPIVAFLSICGFLVFNVALGLFGVLVYNIKKRRAEIGLRKAIGAHPSVILSQFIWEILILTTISVIVGLFFAIQFPLMDVFDVDPGVYARAILFSALVIYSLVLICTIYPSRQAAMVLPANALHEE